MLKVITDCVGGWEEKQLLTVQSEPSAQLSKAAVMPVDRPLAGASVLKAPATPPLTEENGSGSRGTITLKEKSGLRKRSQRLRVWGGDQKNKKDDKNPDRLKTEPLSRAPLWKSPLCQNPPFWSHSTLSSVCETTLARRQTPSLPWDNFSQIPGCWAEGLPTPLWLGCDYLAGALPHQTPTS